MTDTATAGTATPSGGTATASVAAEEPAWAKTLNANIEKLNGTVGKIHDLSAAAQRPVDQQMEDVEGDEPDPLDDPGLDLQPMSVVAKRIMGRVEGVIEKALKPVQERIGQAQVATETTKVTQQVTDFANRTPDFNAWGDEMGAVAKQYPNMHISDIYDLAKVRNPAKVQKLAEEAKKATDAAAAEAAKKAPPARRSMSLSPGGASGEVVNERMSQGDAAKSAWDATVAAFGGSPFA